MDRLLTRRAPRSSRAVAAQAASFGRTSTLMMMFALLLVLVTAMAVTAQEQSNKGGTYEANEALRIDAISNAMPVDLLKK